MWSSRSSRPARSPPNHSYAVVGPRPVGELVPVARGPPTRARRPEPCRGEAVGEDLVDDRLEVPRRAAGAGRGDEVVGVGHVEAAGARRRSARRSRRRRRRAASGTASPGSRPGSVARHQTSVSVSSVDLGPRRRSARRPGRSGRPTASTAVARGTRRSTVTSSPSSRGRLGRRRAPSRRGAAQRERRHRSPLDRARA